MESQNQTICLEATCESPDASGRDARSARLATDLETDPRLERAPIYWMGEAIVYLGLDRLGLARPDKAIYRLIKKGALHPKKIAGRFAFDKAELDLLAANGDQKRSRGRPRKLETAQKRHKEKCD